MSISTPSGATPRMLKWARETAHLSLDDVAKSEGLTIEELTSWEVGTTTPSLAKLRSLATRYKRPLMVFYLQAPPTGFSVVKDFRLLPEGEDRTFSPALVTEIRSAQERQSWVSQYLADEGAPKSKLVGSADINKDDPNEIGSQLRDQLSISLADLSRCVNASEPYQLWRRACEKAGILVFQSRGVDVTEMRGFALPDDYAPVAVVNARDTYNARVFTLIHEVAHILIAARGVSGAGVYMFAPKATKRIERFCNQVAAEVLVPRKDFEARVPRRWEANEDDSLEMLAKTYRVSQAVIVLRLFDVEFADWDFVRSRLAMLKTPTRRKKKSVPVPQYRVALARSGRTFGRTAISAYRAGDIHGGELSNLLAMSMKHFAAYESELFPHRRQA